MTDDGAPPGLERLRPVVRVGGPRSGIWLFAGGCVIVAAGLFIALDARRHAVSAPGFLRHDGAASAFTRVPPLVIPSRPPADFPAVPVVMAEPVQIPTGAAALPTPSYAGNGPLPPPPPLPQSIAPSSAFGQPTPARLGEPALVFDQSAPDVAPPAGGAGGAGDGDGAPTRATVIRGQSTMIVQGSLIAATLETPIDSTRAGLVRAIVARDARSFDGSRTLIPRGSRLIGEYASDVQSGQKRILVTWNRLIRADGVAIRIGSPAADGLGQAGIPGRANSHFLARFASAVLQSALAIGTNLASRPGDGSIIVGLPSTATNSVGQLLSPGADLRTTIKVRQGASLTIFVARDLDFSGVTARQ